jgi:hypothetical protein
MSAMRDALRREGIPIDPRQSPLFQAFYASATPRTNPGMTGYTGPRRGTDTHKRCTGCGRFLPRDAFRPDNTSGRDHVSPRCTPCYNAYQRQWQQRRKAAA